MREETRVGMSLVGVVLLWILTLFGMRAVVMWEDDTFIAQKARRERERRERDHELE